MAELERLQEFLKSETKRVQREIEAVLDGIGTPQQGWIAN